tara:strand:+ start:288 stop:1031 length:744 start_codon:yes stop_codon:yes gene_type:complete
MSDIDTQPDEIEPEGPFANLGALLAGPVIALQEAQIEAEKQVMEFILQYGLEAPAGGGEAGDETAASGDALQKIATLRFEMDQVISDPQNVGSVVARRAEVTVPLLSLMRLPGLQISDAKIDLAVELEESGQSESRETRGDGGAGGRDTGGRGRRPRTGPGGLRSGTTVARLSPLVRARLAKLNMTKDVKPVVGRIASRSSRAFRNRGKLNISLTVKSTSGDEIYDRLTRMLGDSITALVDSDGDQG